MWISKLLPEDFIQYQGEHFRDQGRATGRTTAHALSQISQAMLKPMQFHIIQDCEPHRRHTRTVLVPLIRKHIERMELKHLEITYVGGTDEYRMYYDIYRKMNLPSKCPKLCPFCK